MVLKLEELIDLEAFRNRTAMFIGENKISNLNSFIDGYYYGLEVNCLENSHLLEGFNDWITNYYNYFESTAGWKNILLNECDGDEEKSIQVFFELYDEYKLEKNNLRK